MILNLLLGPNAQDLGTPPMSASPFSLLPAASTSAQAVDDVYIFITLICAIAFVILIGTQVYFMVKYKKPKSGHRKTSPLTHSGKLEFWWSFIPALIMLVMFGWGEKLYMEMAVPPDDAISIRVTAQKWSWTIEYPDTAGAVLTDELIVPVGIPVRLTMTSRDVIHSFFVPAFRQKKDVLPNRYTTMWFEASKIGVYPLFCAEYCGEEHSSMIGTVRVVGPDEFQVALAEAARLEQDDGESMIDFGERVWKRGGCASCHSLDGTVKTGPSLLDKYGTEETLVDGSTVTIDDNYIRESLIEPNAKIVQGFTPQMPSFAGRFDDKAIAGLIEFIKSNESQ